VRKRYGVVKRSSPERRTFQGVVYDSLLEMHRAWQLRTMQVGTLEREGLTWEPHPKFTLGCPENTYTADFRVWTPDHPHLCWIQRGRRRIVDTPDGYVEEVKGPVRTGIGRLKKLWKAYGPVPLVLLTWEHGTGLGTTWARTVILPAKCADE
jgi:hypothetical protein